jgi:hypothetical protein
MNTRIICVLLLLALSATAMADDRHHDHHNHHNHHNEQGGKCMECKNCRSNDNWCYANCKRDCGGIDIEKCKRYGQDVGYNAAKTACELTTTFCKQMQRSFGAPQRSKVSLAQCGNAAYGVCQNMASDRNKSPCGWAFDRGMYNCDKERFWAFYGPVAESECNAATAKFQ